MLIIFLPVVNNEDAVLLVEVYPQILLSVITEIFDRYQEWTSAFQLKGLCRKETLLGMQHLFVQVNAMLL